MISRISCVRSDGAANLNCVSSKSPSSKSALLTAVLCRPKKGESVYSNVVVQFIVQPHHTQWKGLSLRLHWITTFYVSGIVIFKEKWTGTYFNKPEISMRWHNLLQYNTNVTPPTTLRVNMTTRLITLFQLNDFILSLHLFPTDSILYFTIFLFF